MGRPIKIQQISREHAGDQIVVTGVTGTFKWNYLADAVKSQVKSILNINGLGDALTDVDKTFTLGVDPSQPYKKVEDWETPQGDTDSGGAKPDDGENGSGGDGSQGESESEGEGESQGSGDPKEAFDNPYDADGQPKDGSGDGQPPDSPVLHSELNGIAQQIGFATLDAAAATFVSTESFKGFAQIMAKGGIETNNRVDRMEDRIQGLAAEVAAIPQGSGNGGAGFLRIEVRTPTKVDIKDGLFHAQFPKLVRWVGSGNHVYLPGPPGTGKSHAANQVAQTLGWRFGSISLGPTTPESRLWGGKDANGNFHEPTFIELARFAQDNPESGAVFCMDEMDNGHPGVIATLNSAMANGWFTAPNGDVIVTGANFVIVAAANTYGTGPTAEFAGRNRLDAATLDRFLYLPWDTDLNVEETLVKAHLAGVENGTAKAEDWLDVWRTARASVADHGLKVFVTMRGAVNGAKLIAGGEGLRSTLDGVLMSKIPADQAKKINPL